MSDYDDLPEDDINEVMEEVAEVGESDAPLFGGDLFGPPQPGARYRCDEHGLILARRVDWLPDGRPHCPTCGKLLTIETDA